MSRVSRGFTLIELLIVMAIAAIVMSVSAPYVSVWIENYHLGNTARSLKTLYYQARATAIKKNTTTCISFNQDFLEKANTLIDPDPCPAKESLRSYFAYTNPNKTCNAGNDLTNFDPSNGYEVIDCGRFYRDVERDNYGYCDSSNSIFGYWPDGAARIHTGQSVNMRGWVRIKIVDKTDVEKYRGLCLDRNGNIKIIESKTLTCGTFDAECQ